MADASNSLVIAGCLEQVVHRDDVDLPPNRNNVKWVTASWLLCQLKRAGGTPGTNQQLNLVLDDLGIRRNNSTGRVCLSHLKQVQQEGGIADYIRTLERLEEKRADHTVVVSLEADLSGFASPGGLEAPQETVFDSETSKGPESQEIAEVDC